MIRFVRASWWRQAGVLLACLAGPVCYGHEGYYGTAKVDINPQTPIMLSGYAGRAGMSEATGVQQNIVAQAAAFGMGADTTLLFTVDCTGLPDNVVDPLRRQLSLDLGIGEERIVMASTHSHSGPCIDGYLTNLFGGPMSANRQQHVTQYTTQLTGWLEQAATQALDSRTPGHELFWGNGSVGFGTNRRGGSVVDHDLPVMLVRDSLGAIKTVITSYATHAVTLNGGDNLVSGDWPGYAREAIEAMYPGANAMIMIGAAADSNPSGMGSVVSARSHGQTIANEVQRLINGNLLTPTSSQISAFHSEIELDYATSLMPGDPASAMLASSPSSSMYGVTTWTFGKDLAMVFMEGEVVVDYSLRLKAELGDKVWVNGYSNDVQGYIPSERILYEGGYEADSSNYYYANPGRYAHGLEDKIVHEVHDHLLDFSGLADRLRLVVNWGTGEMEIANLGDETLAIDAYTIASPDGKLNPASSRWQSFQDQGLAGWDQADNSNALRLTEFNPTGTRTFAPGDRASIGRPLMVSAPAKFGDDVDQVHLDFEYSIAGVGIEEGLVQGALTSDVINNLVLSVDPSTGAAAIRNASPFFDVAITAYTISSAAGNLRAANGHWLSLADQSITGWDEADNSGPYRLTEFNVAGSTFLAEGEATLDLGALLAVSGDEMNLDDLKFEFLLTTGQTMTGVVQAAMISQGDFDRNGIVDGSDFLMWQRTLGTTVSALGAGADGNANGVIDAADLAIWKKRFGTMVTVNPASRTTSAVVPEPSTLLLIGTLFPALAALRSVDPGKRRCCGHRAAI